VAHSLKICHFQGDSLLFRQCLERFLHGLAGIGLDEDIRLWIGRRTVFLWVKRLGFFLMPAGRANRMQ